MDYKRSYDKQTSSGPTGPVADKPLQLACNYFRFNMQNKQNMFFKYSIDIVPELPSDSKSLRYKVWDAAKAEITKKYGNTVYNNTLFYAQQNIAVDEETTCIYNETSYTIKSKWVQTIEKSSVESLPLFKRFYNSLLRKINFIQIRRNYYNPKKAVFLQQFGDLEIWPGFISSINQFKDGALLNIQTSHRLIRTDTAYDIIKSVLKNTQNLNQAKTELNEIFKGCVILTRYNGDKTYIVEGIEFGKTPNSTFETKNGTTSFEEYYMKKYGKKIENKDQPLLIHKEKKTEQEIYLVPELCMMTGISEEMRNNFNLMKEIANLSKGNARKKVDECKNLITNFSQNEKCKTEMNNWGISIANEPLIINAIKMDVGNILLAANDQGRVSFNLEAAGNDLDRRIQAPMYSQPEIKSWTILANQKDQKEVENLIKLFQEVRNTFRYPMDKPEIIYIKGNRLNEWENVLGSLNRNTKMVLCILGGAKGKGIFYNEIKRYLFARMSIPSQIILVSTIMKGKNLRSIINKVLMQICAKVGGEPWALDQMPFVDVPTCVVSIDFYDKGSRPVMAVVLSINKTFSRFCSVVVEKDQRIEVNIKNAMTHVIDLFKRNAGNNAPVHIIMLRDGVTPSKAKEVADIEIKELNSIIESLEVNERFKDKKSLTYIMLNKKSNLKLFNFNKNNKDYEGCAPGTVVDDVIANDKGFKEFFMISQLVRQGCASATHYNIMFDSYKSNKKDIFLMMYKLCHLYYNWTGGIKVPAPCQYSRRLAYMVGEKLTERNEVFLPGKALWEEHKSLYFL